MTNGRLDRLAQLIDTNTHSTVTLNAELPKLRKELAEFNRVYRYATPPDDPTLYYVLSFVVGMAAGLLTAMSTFAYLVISAT